MIHETRQLLRLRSLRVQRARERVAQALAAVEAATHAVRERQHAVARAQREIEAHAHRVVHGLAPRMPRWSDVAAAQRDRLHECLERAQYALCDDEHALEQAQEQAQSMRADLTRALAREDAVRGMAHDAQRAAALAIEQKLERESDDQIRRPR